ncbi:MAG: tetratricopeptide repeat protein [Polyangiaceae bacterium]
MLPLEPLAEVSQVERLILRARASEAAAEIARLEALTLPPVQEAARTYARGALAMREGSLAPAEADFQAASSGFHAVGETEASHLARAEALLAKMRRGPKQAFSEAESALGDLAQATTFARVRVVATHYRGAALRLLGDAQGTQKNLLDALGMAGEHPAERPKILNSLGTLYVVLGAYGAAEALLEHAAELHHRRGDAVGEAIACGQLGAAALGLGNLEKARTWLQRQEWLASQVGDAFGRARALTFLADVALDLGRPDDALEMANLAREVARSTTPPLAIWLAYATRAAGRAKADLHDKTAEAELRDARARFTTIGNSLGLALTEWDLVRLSGGEVKPIEGDGTNGESLTWSGPAWALASLGLSARVAGLLRDHADQRDAPWRERFPLQHELAAPPGAAPGPKLRSPIADAEEAFFAVAQSAPHLGVPREIALVYEAPGVLGEVSSRRTSAQRNLARLGALTIAQVGLVIATIRWTGAPAFRALPPERASCAAIGALPGVAQWAWPLATPEPEVERDVTTLRAALEASGAKDVLITLEKHPTARVVSPPFAGEVAATVEGLG